ncbi:MAG: hypothetical protein AB7I41_15350 [Candidatus Sericytochromatia bacterium]
MQRFTLLAVLLSLLLALPASAEEKSHDPERPAMEDPEANADSEADSEDDSEDEDECECDDEDEDHHDENDFSRAFLEGSNNLFSASAVEADSFYLLYSHNFFQTSFPRSSNPAFWLRYSPLDRLQIDALATLRTTSDYPFEGELGLGYQILNEDDGDWFNLMPRIAYNSRGHIFGAELAASKYLFPEIWQVGLNARFLSSGKPDRFDRPVGAIGLNTMVRVWKHWHLFGDVVVPLDNEILQQRSVLWSAGIKKIIPDTPHVLTLFAGNTQEQSLAGRTISQSNVLGDVFRVGFVFSIDIEEVSSLPSKLF